MNHRLILVSLLQIAAVALHATDRIALVIGNNAFHLLFVPFVCFVGQLQAQTATPRHALVMGVGDYAGATYKGKAIPNLPGITTADLPNMAAKLESLGFTVTVVPNPSLVEAKAAVDGFSARIKAAPGVSLFYFSGHGGEYEGKNYLIPKKASISSKADLADEALSAQRVLNGMEESGAQVNLVFLDCCREDLGKSVSGAEMQPMRAKGSFIGFATRSGDFADPGADKEGSPYTRFLLKHLDKPGVSVADMYGYVVKDVKDYTKQILGEERRPGFYSELEGEPFYFVPVKFTPPSSSTSAMSEAEIKRREEQKARELVAKMTPNRNSSLPAASSDSNGILKAENILLIADPSQLSHGAIGKVIEIKLPGDVPMKFCFCPPGTFTMGSPNSEYLRENNEDQAQVNISKGFWIAQTECTQEQWKAVTGKDIRYQAKLKENSEFLYTQLPFGEGADFPLHYVSHEEATSFCGKLQGIITLPPGWSVALPTEAQWEYACRTPSNPNGPYPIFSFGDSIGPNQARFDSNQTAKVASYPANKWGIFDMHGNVAEWCIDRDAGKLPGGNDPKGAATGEYRIYRGGSWSSPSGQCRAAFRFGLKPDYRSKSLGFRPAIVPSS